MTAFPHVPAAAAAPAAGIDTTDIGLDFATANAAPLGVASHAQSTALRDDATVRVVLLEELAQVAERIGSLLFDDEHVRLVETVREGAAAMEHLAAARADVVIIDALMQGQLSGLEVARRMRAAGMNTPIIFLTVPDRPVTLTPEMGIARVVTMPLERDTLLGAIVRVDDVHRGPVHGPPSGVIGVFSAKGGVGRTTIAHNLAASLAGRPGTRVALVDGDLVHGDLRLHLGAPEAAPSLLQLPTGHVTEVDVAPLLWRDLEGVDVLLAPPRMEQADLIMQRDVETALAVLSRLYDVVIIDVPAVMSELSLAMLDRADVVLDVVTTERGSVLKAQRCRDVLTAAGFPMGKIVTVVNRTGDPGLDREALTALIGCQPDVALPSDPSLAVGELERGLAIVARRPGAPISHAFAGLAELVAERLRTDTRPLEARAA
jgi:MinD-like ATPase involved in chromosome partitioning or flagellar assembly